MATFHSIIDKGKYGAVDRLSNLPDHIVQHILSFLETRQSVQTSILSKRWKNLWISVPDLTFDMASFNHRRSNFQQFFVKVMAQREANNIRKVSRLSICYPEQFLDKRSSSSCVNMVLDHYAASHGVDHLFVKGAFRVILQNLRLNELELSKLTTLHLEYCWWPYGAHSDTECFDFSAVCPNLVNLFLSSCFVWRFKVLKISGAKLVNLTMNWVGCDHTVEISAPKLVFLKIKGETELNFSAINLPSLNHAEVGYVLCDGRWKQNDVQIMQDMWGMKRLFAENMLKFFQGLRNAESLALCTSSVAALAMVMDRIEVQPSPFSRLKSLKFIDSDNPLKIPAKVLNYLLSGSSCVETVLTEFRNDYP